MAHAGSRLKPTEGPERHRLESQPSSRTGENPPYGMIGRIEETSASYEARSAPRSYPTAFARFEGALSGPAKDAAIGKFRERVPVLLCTESGGEGRNLQFCNTLINFDVPWNPMAIEQRIGRIDRIGQQ